MITFENVSKFVLSGISIHIPRGECVGLIGSSGAGKTTFLKVAAGLLAPDHGYVRMLGKDPVVHRGKYGSELASFMTGIPSLEKADTVIQNFEILRSVYRIPEKLFRKDYHELSVCMDFEKLAGERVKNLSLGQRMRVELAAGLICRPKLLLLDEPDVGLDENGKAAFGGLLSKRCQEGMTVLIASHNLGEVSRSCSRIALIHQGRLIYYGSENRLRSRYAPMDTMTLKVSGRLPDLDDLPVKKYSVDHESQIHDILKLSYNSNHVTAAEILEAILGQTKVEEIKIRKSQLEDIILQCSHAEEEKLPDEAERIRSLVNASA